MKFKELSKQEFSKFAQPHPQGNFLQTTAQADLMAKRAWKTTLVGLVDDDNQVQAAAVLAWIPVRMGNLFKIDGGMLIDYTNVELVKEFVAGVSDFAKHHNGLFLEVVPNKSYRTFNVKGEPLSEPDETVLKTLTQIGFTHNPVAKGWTTNEAPTWQYVKDLRPILASDNPEKALVKSFAKDGKYYLKKTEQFGIKIHRLKREELGEFKKLTQSTADRLHYHDKDLDFYQTAYDCFGDDVHFVFAEMNFAEYIKGQKERIEELNQIIAKLNDKIENKNYGKKLVGQRNEYEDQLKQHLKRIERAEADRKLAGENQVVIAGAMFIATENEWIYLYSGTYEQYKQYYGPYAVQGYAFREALKRQIPQYNFYGISGIFDGSDGVLYFKEGFGGHVEEKVGTFTLPLNKPKYFIYKTLKKMLNR